MWQNYLKKQVDQTAGDSGKKELLFWFLLTGPAGAAINNLLVYLTRVPGGDDLAGFDAERAPSQPPPKAPLFSLSASLGVICELLFSS